MARRDRGHNPASHHFVGDFASGPVADGPFFRLLAGHRHDLARLLCGDLRRSSWTWDIGEPFAHRQVRERHRLQTNPAHAPTAHRIHAHAQVSALFSAYRQLRWFGPFLHLFSSSLFPPILPHTYFSRNVLVP